MSRAALLIGTSLYRDSALNDLPASGSDVSALAAVLSDRDVGNYRVEQLQDAAYHLLAETTGVFLADRSVDDELLIYLSGHALRNVEQELYFAASNTRCEQLEETTFPASVLSRQLNRCRAGRIVVLLDCCFAGGFSLGAVAKGAVPNVSDDLRGGGRVVIGAATGSEYAFVGKSSDAPRLSAFTAAVVEGLSSGDADRDSDGIVSPEDLFGYVREQLARAEPQQVPTFTSEEMHGSWVIANSSKRLRNSAASPDLSPGFGPRHPTPQRLGELLGPVIEEADAMVGGDRDSILLPTGLTALDDLIAGYRPGQLVLVRGETGVGKSNFVVGAAREAAIVRNMPTTFLSLDLDAKALVRRVLAAEARTPVHFIEDGRMRTRDWDAFTRVLPKVNEAPLTIVDGTESSGLGLRELVNSSAAFEGLRLLIIDGLHEFTDPEDELKLTATIRWLRDVARRQNVALLATISNEGASDPTHSVADSLDRSADVIITIDRPDVRGEDERAGEADLYVRTRRFPLARVAVVYQGHYSRFLDFAVRP